MECAFPEASFVKISIAATNPCHLHPLAIELSRAGALGTYYSGYPKWKLRRTGNLPIRTHSLRTSVVYACLRFLPEKVRPSSRTLFLWQDQSFDRWVGRQLSSADFIHAMPGQCLATFHAAQRLGIRTVLNHATGPVRDWVRIMEPEYRRVGLRIAEISPYDDRYFAREAQEYARSDFHCAASTIVRDQLVALGIDPTRIWLVSYGADPDIFYSEGNAGSPVFRICFAGQVGLRKGIKTLLDALTLAGRPEWRADFYGTVLSEARHDLDGYRGATPLTFRGAVSQEELAREFRESSILVLPSLEEGFGLVVPQALACGTPCVVSDRVGGKDLIHHRNNGSIFPVQDATALAAELSWWADHPRRLETSFHWTEPAHRLIALSRAALS